MFHLTAGLLCVFVVISIKVKGSGFLEVRIYTTRLFLSLCFTFLLYHLPEFRGGKSPILIATDVASRGLGIVCSHLTNRLVPLLSRSFSLSPFPLSPSLIIFVTYGSLFSLCRARFFIPVGSVFSQMAELFGSVDCAMLLAPVRAILRGVHVATIRSNCRASLFFNFVKLCIFSR